ncbi:hypothetical protein Syun_028113 [Stephania yunnanensis]|uniref:Uncharacterized protein n=1 Tax=Stephania yunnanensis TaxID=152371 RepID=A0AAP0EK49_9MAGN
MSDNNSESKMKSGHQKFILERFKGFLDAIWSIKLQIIENFVKFLWRLIGLINEL